MNNHSENIPRINNQTYRMSSSREASQISSRLSSSHSSHRGSHFQDPPPYINSVRNNDYFEHNKKENITISEEYIQRENTILSKHDANSFPEKPRELYNPLNGLLPEKKVASKTFNVLPAISTPRSLTSRSSTSSQLSSRREVGANNTSNSPRSGEITPVILPPINKNRWNALRQSEDVNLLNGRAYWDVTQLSSRQSTSHDYRSSPDGFS